MFSPIDQLTEETLDTIFSRVEDGSRKEMVALMNSYFTRRQQLELAADREIRDLRTQEIQKIVQRSVDIRPEGF